MMLVGIVLFVCGGVRSNVLNEVLERMNLFSGSKRTLYLMGRERVVFFMFLGDLPFKVMMS